MTWTEPRVDLLKELTALHLSGAAIADRLNVTRNAVLGKQHRLGISSGIGKDGQPPSNTAGRYSIPAKVKAKQKRLAELVEQDAVVNLPADQSLYAVPFFDVQPGQCRYPLGDTSNLKTFRFCGAPKIDGCSYCRRHFKITHVNR